MSINAIQKCKRPQEGADCIPWRRGWDMRGSSLSRALRTLRVLRTSSAVQIRSGRICRTRVGSSTNPLQKCKRPQEGADCISWRRGWDSNPRYGKTVHRISNPAHSTTLPPLRMGIAQDRSDAARWTIRRRVDPGECSGPRMIRAVRPRYNLYASQNACSVMALAAVSQALPT